MIKESARGWRWVPIIGYAVVIVMLTLTSHRRAAGAMHPSFVPFESIAHLVSGGVRRATVVKNLLGNLLLFAPLAVLLRLLVVRSAARALAVVLLASVAVEVVQGLGLPNGRQANVDDVLLNVTGAALALALTRRATMAR